jgi:hypothetical protein
LASAEGGEYDLIVLNAGDVLHDAFAVRRPGPAAKKLVDRLNTKAEVEDGKSVTRSAQPNRGPQ